MCQKSPPHTRHHPCQGLGGRCAACTSPYRLCHRSCSWACPASAANPCHAARSRTASSAAARPDSCPSAAPCPSESLQAMGQRRELPHHGLHLARQHLRLSLRFDGDRGRITSLTQEIGSEAMKPHLTGQPHQQQQLRRAQALGTRPIQAIEQMAGGGLRRLIRPDQRPHLLGAPQRFHRILRGVHFIFIQQRTIHSSSPHDCAARNVPNGSESFGTVRNAFFGQKKETSVHGPMHSNNREQKARQPRAPRGGKEHEGRKRGHRCKRPRGGK